MLWDSLDRGLWGIAITILLMVGIFYLNKGKKRENSNERIVMYGFTVYLVLSAACFVFLYLQAISRPGVFINGIFYGDFDAPLTIATKLFSMSYNILFLASHFLLLLAIEKVLNLTKYLVSLINLVIIVIIIIFLALAIFGNGSTTIFAEIALVLGDIFKYIRFVFLLVICYYATKWAQLEFKSVTAFLFLGYILIQWGAELATGYKGLGLIPLFLPPIITIIGTLSFIIPQLITSRYLSKALTIWKIIGTTIIGFSVARDLYFIYIGIWNFNYNIIFGNITISLIMYAIIQHIFSELSLKPKEPKRISQFVILWKIIGISVICSYLLITLYLISGGFSIDYSTFAYNFLAYILAIYILIKNIKTEKSTESKIEFKEILGIFTKPENLTEEEITFHKEQKICLVCKGNVIGFNSFICKCDALYCLKCAQTLSDLENACWVCEEPFDELKPVKLYKEKEDDLIVEEKPHKKIIFKVKNKENSLDKNK